MVGPMVFAYTDKEAGRMVLRGRARYKYGDGQTMYPRVEFWRPKEDG